MKVLPENRKYSSHFATYDEITKVIKFAVVAAVQPWPLAGSLELEPRGGDETWFPDHT